MRPCVIFLLMLLTALACSKDNDVHVQQEVCATGQYTCKGDRLQQCNANRSGWDDVALCVTGTCVQGSSHCPAPSDAGADSATGGDGAAGAGGGPGVGGAAGAAGKPSTCSFDNPSSRFDEGCVFAP